MKTWALSKRDRDFLRLVSEAAFANPFGPRRIELNAMLSGAGGVGSPDANLLRAIANVGACVERLSKEGPCRPALYRGEDRPLVELAVLFDVFHRCLESFDAHIEEQMRSGDTPLRVPSAEAAMRVLCEHGFPHETAVRHVSMFFQLRRAFFFLARSLLGESESMIALKSALWNCVFTHDTWRYAKWLWDRMEDFSTLLLGETGTGKGAAAAAIGRSGYIPFDPRKGAFSESFTRSFVSLNLSQFPEALIESELFGHRKGAFTGAVDSHEGVFARCSPHGAIFLDEIGDVATPVQIKLLRVLQERVFTPVGSHETRRFSGRVVAATNEPLAQLRRTGQFRDDFYYRLCSDVITVPPLRQRFREHPGERALLVGHLVKRLTGDDAPDLVGRVNAALAKSPGPDYAWPGNVRELEQAVRRILLSGAYTGDAPSSSEDVQARLLAGMDAGTLSASELLSEYCRILHARFGTFEEVARRTGLDRRTVKKHIGRFSRPSARTTSDGMPPD